jgi:hypothetical protein
MGRRPAEVESTLRSTLRSSPSAAAPVGTRRARGGGEMLKQRKEEIVSSLTEEFGGVTQMIIADPTGLTVAEMADLRNKLRPSAHRGPRSRPRGTGRTARRSDGHHARPRRSRGCGQDAVRLRSHVAQARTARCVPGRRGVRRRQRQAARDAAVARAAADQPGRQHAVADQRLRERAGPAAAQPGRRARSGPDPEGSGLGRLTPR